MSLIETENASDLVVNLQLAKIWSGLRPLHLPVYGCDKISFVHAVPKMRAELDRYDPAKSEKKVGSGKLWRQPCRLQSFDVRRRHVRQADGLVPWRACRHSQ